MAQRKLRFAEGGRTQDPGTHSVAEQLGNLGSFLTLIH